MILVVFTIGRQLGPDTMLVEDGNDGFEVELSDIPEDLETRLVLVPTGIPVASGGKGADVDETFDKMLVPLGCDLPVPMLVPVPVPSKDDSDDPVELVKLGDAPGANVLAPLLEFGVAGPGADLDGGMITVTVEPPLINFV